MCFNHGSSRCASIPKPVDCRVLFVFYISVGLISAVLLPFEKKAINAAYGGHMRLTYFETTLALKN